MQNGLLVLHYCVSQDKLSLIEMMQLALGVNNPLSALSKTDGTIHVCPVIDLIGKTCWIGLYEDWWLFLLTIFQPKKKTEEKYVTIVNKRLLVFQAKVNQLKNICIEYNDFALWKANSTSELNVWNCNCYCEISIELYHAFRCSRQCLNLPYLSWPAFKANLAIIIRIFTTVKSLSKPFILVLILTQIFL